jgi:hypothetical protein
LYKQKGILITKAYKNWDLFKTSSLLRTVDQRLCKTIFASKWCRGEKASIWICACDRSSPYG